MTFDDGLTFAYKQGLLCTHRCLILLLTTKKFLFLKNQHFGIAALSESTHLALLALRVELTNTTLHFNPHFIVSCQQFISSNVQTLVRWLVYYRCTIQYLAQEFKLNRLTTHSFPRTKFRVTVTFQEQFIELLFSSHCC